MKKVLSVVLLISMLLGMWIMPAAAAEGDGASGTGETSLAPTFYMDAKSDKAVLDAFFLAEANYEVVTEEGESFIDVKPAAVAPAPGGQTILFDAPLIMTAEINCMPVTKEGANVQLWLNLKEDLTHKFQYFPLEKKFVLAGPSGELQTVETDWATGENAEWHRITMSVEADGTITCYADDTAVITYQIPNFNASIQTGLVPIFWKDGNFELLLKSFAVYELDQVTGTHPEVYFNLNTESKPTTEFLNAFFGDPNVYELQEDGTIYMKSGAVAPGPTTGAANQDFFIKGDFVTEVSLKMIGTSYKEDAYRSVWVNTSHGMKTLQYNPGKGTVTYGAWNGEADFTKEVDWATGENAEWHTLALEVLPDAGMIKSYVDGELVHTAVYAAFTDQTDGKGFQPLLFGNCESLMQYCNVITGAYTPGYAVGHDETQNVLTLKANTCTEAGKELVRCTGCGKLAAVEVAAAGHTSSDWIVDTAASCTAKGSQHKECTVCGETLETEEIAMLDHTPSDWIVDKEATEEEEGSKHKECTVCEAVLETEAIPKLDPQKPPFTDVAEDAWYYEYVAYVYRNNLFLGTSDTTFEPDTTMTRAMFVRLLANYEGVDFTQYEDAELPFTDVDMDEWYGTAVAWAYENEVVLGTSETTFNPGDEITREQMCLMLVNYMNYKEITLTVSDEEISFTDADQIADWAREAVEFCAAAGIVKGPGDGSFNPKGIASRAEVATLITNFCNALADQPAE